MFSNLMPGGGGTGRSFYENLRNKHDSNSDIEDRAGLLDEENLNHEFQDYDLDQIEGLAVDDSRISEAPARPQGGRGGLSTQRPHRATGNSRWFGGHGQDDDGDNDVPASLLVEPHDMVDATNAGQRRKAGDLRKSPPPIPGPATRTARLQWESTQNQQRLHRDDTRSRGHHAPPGAFLANALNGDAKKKAEWRWANVSNLDNFMHDVYAYYLGHGFWCILLERALHLVNVAFVAVFLTFMTQCVNYSKIRGSKTMSEILVPQCTKKMSGLWNLGLWLFAFYFIFKLITYTVDLRRLSHTRDFYVHMLNIPEDDMQTVTWQDVIARIMALRDQNPRTAMALNPAARNFLGSQSKERLDASDIANRLMRRENYLIGLFNKDVLDLKLTIPFVGTQELLSQTLEWTLWFSILDFVFDQNGQVHQEFLKSDRRGELSAKLRGRFLFAGAMNLVLAPFLVAYLIIVYFLTYYQEYQKNPSAISARSYTPLAKWKFREFNELPHIFEKRLNMSQAYATHYIDQFPKIKTEMVFRTVAFIAGALVTVLAIASLIDPEMFLNFEITHDRTVLFYIGVLGAIWGFAHGSIKEESSVFDPEFALRSVIEYTHHQPEHWNGRLHSYDVKKEFSELYKMKAIIFAEEIMSIILTPLILFFALPRCSDQIIDFFREFTIHVDGLGYVCQWAEFNFKNMGAQAAAKKKQKQNLEDAAGQGQHQPGGSRDVRDDYYSTKHNKMEASYYGFIGNYGNYMLNPKTGTGVPGHLPPGIRHTFNPPPAWPGLGSPAMGGIDHNLATSRMGKSDLRGRSRAGATSLNSRFTAPPVLPSPMGSILLDPHHQPPTATIHAAAAARKSQRGGGGVTAPRVIREDDDEEMDETVPEEEEEAYGGSRGALEESTWQTSPTKNLSREGSGVDKEEPVAGVIGIVKQFSQAQLGRGFGGVR